MKKKKKEKKKKTGPSVYGTIFGNHFRYSYRPGAMGLVLTVVFVTDLGGAMAELFFTSMDAGSRNFKGMMIGYAAVRWK